MASLAEQKKADEYVEQFTRADENKRRNGDNNRPTSKSQCGIRQTRAPKAVTGRTLTDAYERRYGYSDRPLRIRA